MRDTLRLRALCCRFAGMGVASCAWPGTAQAHSPIPGIGVFYSAMLHPLVVPTHALVLVALSLALAQQGRSAARLGLIVLFCAFCAGLAMALALTDALAFQPALLVFAVLVSGLVIVARPLPHWLVAGISLVAGALLGLESGPDPADLQGKLLAIAGVCVGVALLTTVIAGTCLTFEKPWQKIGIRVLGSWLAAVSILVLTLLTHSGPPRPILSPFEDPEVESLS